MHALCVLLPSGSATAKEGARKSGRGARINARYVFNLRTGPPSPACAAALAGLEHARGGELTGARGRGLGRAGRGQGSPSHGKTFALESEGAYTIEHGYSRESLGIQGNIFTVRACMPAHLPQAGPTLDPPKNVFLPLCFRT